MKFFAFYSTFDTLSKTINVLQIRQKNGKKSQILAFAKFFVCYFLLIKILVEWNE